MKRCSTSFEILLVTHSCLTLCDSMDCNPSSSSVHEILQERLWNWVAIPFSRGSSQPKDQNQSPALQWLLYHLSQSFIINKYKMKTTLRYNFSFTRCQNLKGWQSCKKQAVFHGPGENVKWFSTNRGDVTTI